LIRFIITFTEDYSNNEKIIVEQRINQELPKLLKLHDETDIEIEFLSFYVENKYINFSAASNEPKKMWFKVNRFNDFSDIVNNHLRYALCHEFHHMIRWKYRINFNLAELIINEGLATLFTMKLNNSNCPNSIPEFSQKQMEKILPLIKKDLYNSNFNHRNWQKGNKELEIPPSFAYSFGYKLVKDFYEINTEMDILNSFNVDCNLFLPNYLIG